MPDVFVPLDTAAYTKYYMAMRRHNLFNDAALRYVDQNRTTLLERYKRFDDFEKQFEVPQPSSLLALSRSGQKEREAQRRSRAQSHDGRSEICVEVPHRLRCLGSQRVLHACQPQKRCGERSPPPTFGESQQSPPARARADRRPTSLSGGVRRRFPTPARLFASPTARSAPVHCDKNQKLGDRISIGHPSFFCPQTLLIGEITHAHERTYSAYSYHTVLCECNMHYTTTFRRNLRAPGASVFRLPLRRCPKLRNPCVLHRNRFGSQPVGTHRRPPILTSLIKRNESLVGACSASLGFERCKVVDFL